jgi:hypothetical protein
MKNNRREFIKLAGMAGKPGMDISLHQGGTIKLM